MPGSFWYDSMKERLLTGVVIFVEKKAEVDGMVVATAIARAGANLNMIDRSWMQKVMWIMGVELKRESNDDVAFSLRGFRRILMG